MSDLWEEFEHHGRAMRWKLVDDDDGDTPWQREDGHGPVSDWTRRGKKPGERVLVSDRGLSWRYYDFQEAMKIAKRDFWGVPAPGMTQGEATERAVEADYERLKAWCEDRWHYVGVVVEDIDSGYHDSLWGIESDDDAYLLEVRDELASGLHPLASREEAANLDVCSD